MNIHPGYKRNDMKNINVAKQPLLITRSIDTPLGAMTAIASEDALHLLEFSDCFKLEREIERLQKRLNPIIISGTNHVIVSIETELTAYFDGSGMTFKTPFYRLGSLFQNKVWDTLCQIPYGETRSYREQATAMEHPKAVRAVANANGVNPLAIIVPCHRIINTNGTLGGYAGGIARKQWLIQHEKRITR